MRACVLNGTKMACYDSIKGLIVSKTGWSRGDVRCTFTSAVRQRHRHAGTRAALTDLVCSCYHSRWYPFQVCAGFFMTCTVAPFDMLRTTLMNQPTDRKIYNGYVCSRPRAAAGSVHPCCSWVHFRGLLHVFFVCLFSFFSSLCSSVRSTSWLDRFFDAATKIVKEHGPLAFYRGFFPIWGRFAPQATLQLVIFDMLRKLAGFDAI